MTMSESESIIHGLRLVVPLRLRPSIWKMGGRWPVLLDNGRFTFCDFASSLNHDSLQCVVIHFGTCVTQSQCLDSLFSVPLVALPESSKTGNID